MQMASIYNRCGLVRYRSRRSAEKMFGRTVNGSPLHAIHRAGGSVPHVYESASKTGALSRDTAWSDVRTAPHFRADGRRWRSQIMRGPSPSAG